MPPYDPWFGGGYINYYYWGQFLAATLIRVTGIDPAIAYNLAVPMFFALTVAGAFTIVYNLAVATLRGRSGTTGRRGPPAMVAGIAGAAFVTVIGNLDGALQVVQGIVRVWLLNTPFGAFDFWRSTRVMPPDPPGHEITEFPFFTFLFGDLHAHLMAIPFTILALGLALAVVLGARGAKGVVTRGGWRPGDVARLIALGVVVGSLRLINTWDYPTYLLLAAAAALLAAYLRNGGMNVAVLVEAGMKSVLIFAAGYIAFLPFHLNYETFFSSVEKTTNQTVLWQFLLIHGLFMFVVVSYFAIESKGTLLAIGRGLRSAATRGAAAEPVDGDDGPVRVSGGRATALTAVVVVAGLLGIIVITGWTGSTIPFVVLLLGLVLLGGLRRLGSFASDAPTMGFVVLVIGTALMLVIGLDIVRVQGDIDRMNSVFKFYVQVWVLLAVASAYLLWRLVSMRKAIAPSWGRWTKIWVAAAAVLVVSSAVYPLLGTQARLKMRFEILPATLDGMAYMQDVVYHDANGEIDLAADYEGIRWLQDNVEGSPMILEGLTPNYRWGGRVSIYTGLPAIVGWQWHQEQQRWGYRGAVGARAREVEEIFRTTSPEVALSLLDKYAVRYVYIGQLEHLYYPAEGLEKFENGLDGRLKTVWQNDKATIYELGESALDSPLARQ
jgi:YYY domain-containing protein